MARRKKASIDAENSSVRTLSLICSSCGGGLSVEEDSSVLMCPFCGAKELIIDSESVEIEKIRNESQKEIEIEKIKSAERMKIREQEQKKQKKELEDIEKFRKGKLSKVLIIGIILTVIFAFLFFLTSCVISGILASVQALCFVVAWAMGMRAIKGIKHHLHIICIVIAALLVLPVFFTIGETTEYIEDSDWNIIFLKDSIPEPVSKKLDIHENTDDELWVDIHNTSEADYYKFVSECKEMGYTIEAEESSRHYKAYTESGYCIEISYYSSHNELSLEVEKPSELYELNWENHSVSKVLPKPPSDLGLYKRETNDKTEMIIGKISKEQYYKYCDSCRDLGFTIEETGYEYRYSAFSDAGYKLSVVYTPGSLELALTLEYPRDFSEISWPEHGIGAMLPVPFSLSASVEYNNSTSFTVYVDNMPTTEFEKYVQQCIDAGFNKDISKYANSFSAKNATGEDVWVSYKGNEVIYISISGSYDKEYN